MVERGEGSEELIGGHRVAGSLDGKKGNVGEFFHKAPNLVLASFGVEPGPARDLHLLAQGVHKPLIPKEVADHVDIPIAHQDPVFHGSEQLQVLVIHLHVQALVAAVHLKAALLPLQGIREHVKTLPHLQGIQIHGRDCGVGAQQVHPDLLPGYRHPE